MRKFINNELIWSTTTRFATAYLNLLSLLDARQPLKTMFTSTKWLNCAWASKLEGREIRKKCIRWKILDEFVLCYYDNHALNSSHDNSRCRKKATTSTSESTCISALKVGSCSPWISLSSLISSGKINNFAPTYPLKLCFGHCPISSLSKMPPLGSFSSSLILHLLWPS